MHIKEGIIPTIVGTCVTAAGLALKSSTVPDSYRNGLIGFGLAHIVIGSMEMINHENHHNNMITNFTKAAHLR